MDKETLVQLMEIMRPMRYCVVGDTRVKSDRGLIKIKDIVKDSSPNSDNDINLKVLSIIVKS